MMMPSSKADGDMDLGSVDLDMGGTSDGMSAVGIRFASAALPG